MEQLPPKVSHPQVEEPPKANEEMSTEALIEELSVAVARQATLVAQLKAQYAGEGSSSGQKDEEIALLKAQLASAQAALESTTTHSKRLADEKLSLLVDLSHERASFEQYKASCLWGLKYLQENKSKHFAQLDDFRKAVEAALETQEGKLRKLSIEYDEELYPHLVSAVAERRDLILFYFFSSFSLLIPLKLLSCNACVLFEGG
jgi:chromosome segregation ATPase